MPDFVIKRIKQYIAKRRTLTTIYLLSKANHQGQMLCQKKKPCLAYILTLLCIISDKSVVQNISDISTGEMTF